MRKRILILYTGGTIGMRESAQGYQPAPGHLKELIAALPVLKHEDMPGVDLYEYDPLIDSADSSPALWNRIADSIVAHYNDYDGFLILHGTDTMAYTASALSFMLRGLTKPIMMTGSQVPLGLTITDARENFITALYLLQHYPINEVTVYFNNKLFRGNRVTKIKASSFNAFFSPNMEPLIKVAAQIGVEPICLPEQPNSLVAQQISPVKLSCLSLFPGMSADIVRALRESEIQAVIVRSYGVGNAPSQDKQLQKEFEHLAQSGVVLVNTSQCLHASVCMRAYVAGQFLASCGALSAGDMTDEAILCKLYYLFSCGFSVEKIREQFTQNLVGELSVS